MSEKSGSVVTENLTRSQVCDVMQFYLFACKFCYIFGENFVIGVITLNVIRKKFSLLGLARLE